MYVHIDNDAVEALFDADLVPPADEREHDAAAYRLSFSDNNLAQCKRAVGEAYVDAYDDISRHD